MNRSYTNLNKVIQADAETESSNSLKVAKARVVKELFSFCQAESMADAKKEPVKLSTQPAKSSPFKRKSKFSSPKAKKLKVDRNTKKTSMTAEELAQEKQNENNRAVLVLSTYIICLKL